jgi:Holliday junction resolvase RusA-like endonuclease
MARPSGADLRRWAWGNPSMPRKPTAVSFFIPGAPRTKKNHGWRTKQGAQMPSHAFIEWNRSAQVHLAPVARAIKQPIAVTVNCRALFYRDALRGDAVGYYQALADALEEAGIVENDRLIVSWDGSRLLKDADNPRIEVTLEAVE